MTLLCSDLKYDINNKIKREGGIDSKRQCKARQSKAKQGKAKQGKARQGKTHLDRNIELKEVGESIIRQCNTTLS